MDSTYFVEVENGPKVTILRPTLGSCFWSEGRWAQTEVRWRSGLCVGVDTAGARFRVDRRRGCGLVSVDGLFTVVLSLCVVPGPMGLVPRGAILRDFVPGFVPLSSESSSQAGRVHLLAPGDP